MHVCACVWRQEGGNLRGGAYICVEVGGCVHMCVGGGDVWRWERCKGKGGVFMYVWRWEGGACEERRDGGGCEGEGG